MNHDKIRESIFYPWSPSYMHVYVERLPGTVQIIKNLRKQNIYSKGFCCYLEYSVRKIIFYLWGLFFIQDSSHDLKTWSEIRVGFTMKKKNSLTPKVLYIIQGIWLKKQYLLYSWGSICHQNQKKPFFSQDRLQDLTWSE